MRTCWRHPSPPAQDERRLVLANLLIVRAVDEALAELHDAEFGTEMR